MRAFITGRIVMVARITRGKSPDTRSNTGKRTSPSRKRPSYWERAAIDLNRQDAEKEHSKTSDMEPGVRISSGKNSPDRGGRQDRRRLAKARRMTISGY